MNRSSEAIPPDGDHLETEAAQWLAKSDRGFTPQEAEEFARWCAADPRRADIIADLSEAWTALDDLSVLKTEAPAPAPAAAAPVLPFQPVEATPRRSRVRWWPVIGLAAAVVLGLFLFTRTTTPAPAEVRYATVVGGQQRLTLPDASTVQLNTDTAIVVRYTDGERRIILERGEAFFAVAKNPDRPFIVQSGDIEARALGTAFSVRQRDGDTELLVSEGRVRFGAEAATAASPRTADVGACQFAVARRAGGAPSVSVLQAADLKRRLAWQGGLIEFAATPLSEAVSEFNRYHKDRLVVADAATGGVPIGGTYRVDNVDGFLWGMETGFGVGAQRREDHTIVLRLKP